MRIEGTRSARAKAVGIWIRVSTEDQARGESPEHHEKRARAYAESKEGRGDRADAPAARQSQPGTIHHGRKTLAIKNEATPPNPDSLSYISPPLHRCTV